MRLTSRDGRVGGAGAAAARRAAGHLRFRPLAVHRAPAAHDPAWCRPGLAARRPRDRHRRGSPPRADPERQRDVRVVRPRAWTRARCGSASGCATARRSEAGRATGSSPTSSRRGGRDDRPPDDRHRARRRRRRRRRDRAAGPRRRAPRGRRARRGRPKRAARHPAHADRHGDDRRARRRSGRRDSVGRAPGDDAPTGTQASPSPPACSSAASTPAASAGSPPAGRFAWPASTLPTSPSAARTGFRAACPSSRRPR